MRFLSAIVLLSILSACGSSAYKKSEGGVEYKIIDNHGKGEKVKMGDFVEIFITQYYESETTDTVLRSNPDGIPYIEMIDSANMDKVFYNVLTSLKVGDSADIRIITDSLYGANIDAMPPFMKRGHYVRTSMKLVNIYTSETEANEARAAQFAKAQEQGLIKMEEQKKIDEQLLADYFKANNVQTIKSPLGMYVEIKEPGTGALIDTNVVVEVKYTGRLLNGETFDSNVDSAFGHLEPLLVNMTSDPNLGMGVIQGWYEGFKMLRNGAKAKFYIPSALGYGDRGQGNGIPPNSVLVFDVEVVRLLNREQGKAAQEEMIEKVMQRSGMKR